MSEIAPDVPAELEAIVDKAMARDKRARYANVLELSNDLRAYLEHRVVRAYETGPLAELKKWVRRNRATAASLAALVLLALGASLFVAWREGEKQQEVRAAYDELEREQGVKLALADVMATRVLLDELNSFGPGPSGQNGLARWVERVEEVLERPALGIESMDSIGDAERTAHAERLTRLGEVLPLQRQRLEDYRSLYELTFVEHRQDWERCCAEVEIHGKYDRLELAPQLGLVPLRTDPESGLWEFWHAQSGTRPRPSASGPGYDLEVETGIVLVLVPGGRYSMGSAFDAPGHERDETLHEESVAPFFIAKYELTQAQWQRVMGSNPSFQPAGFQVGATRTNAMHPVETISWFEADRVAALSGLRLPTEAEWEYAARGGSDAAYAFGPAPEELYGRENVADASHVASYWHPTASEIVHAADWDDGFPGTAPVGSFEPTPFGLFDVHGNVGEWTSTLYLGDYGAAPPAAPPAFGHTEERVVRGGNAVFGPSYARLPSRQPVPPTNASRIVGLRPARDVERP